jgi:DNA modification methylase
MRWLCGLIKMPSGNLVIDPFCGTASTLIACHQLGMDAVGIEQDADYVRIARLRMKAYEDRPAQLQTENLFKETT